MRASEEKILLEALQPGVHRIDGTAGRCAGLCNGHPSDAGGAEKGDPRDHRPGADRAGGCRESPQR